MTYSIYSFGSMMGDSTRMEAYVQALKQTIHSNSVVLDLGTGTGIFSLLACKFGARQVYAIDTNNAIHIAKQLACDNGYGGRIEFIQNQSTKVQLPEKVDLIVSDLRGSLPLYSLHIPTIIDARHRFLKRNGILLPKMDQMWVVLVRASTLYKRFTSPWGKNQYDLNLDAKHQVLLNFPRREKVKPNQLMSKPQLWGKLDYARINNPNFEGEIRFVIEKSGITHGFLVWFDATIFEGITFSGGPGANNKMVYGNMFFPWNHPVKLAKKDRVIIKLKANLVGEEYVWQWKTEIFDPDHPRIAKVKFLQSTFHGNFLPPASLRKRAGNYIPNLSKEGEIKKFVLQHMNRKSSLETIADLLIKNFRDRFTTPKEALAYVGDMSIQYSD